MDPSLRLFGLPFELQQQIYGHLAPWMINELCLTSQAGREQCIPHLYRHITIKTRRQFKNLQQASPNLTREIKHHTKQLTLTCQQASSQWLLSHTMLSWCQQALPNLTSVSLHDFTLLDIDQLASFIGRLPTVTQLGLYYSNLIIQNQPEAMLPMLPEDHDQTSLYQLPDHYYHRSPSQQAATIFQTVRATSYFSSSAYPTSSQINTPFHIATPEPISPPVQRLPLTHLDLEWTDFSTTAIDRLLSLVPDLTHLFLGANHNRLANANDNCIASLPIHCPTIHHLTIALQQITPSVLASCLDRYGPRLATLHLHSQEWSVLSKIPRVHLQSLSLHGQAHRPMDTRSNPTKLPQPPVPRSTNNQAHKPHRNATQHPRWNLLLGAVQQCRRLQMSVFDWSLSDLPPLIQQHAVTTSSSVVLDEKLLDEIRALYL
ncbi:hypothetical protein DM01DRAFT_1337385 [Hesseltinella vesiculosa]|uniref:Uncharacterized protein n=1 Tax=Hesseltinella vesiculosa TaxID=101127 RepID=A0A1X2GDP5_9FUNG|nr:hypothetical protein DM01DRAFT_1337385 [Hesseltinella vesiculosa]